MRNEIEDLELCKSGKNSNKTFIFILYGFKNVVECTEWVNIVWQIYKVECVHFDILIFL